MKGFSVPSKPQILNNLQDLIDVEEPNIEKISDLISEDINLSATILKIINSPFYGMKRTISEIKQAVMFIGLDTIKGLVNAIILKQTFKGESSISLEKF